MEGANQIQRCGTEETPAPVFRFAGYAVVSISEPLLSFTAPAANWFAGVFCFRRLCLLSVTSYRTRIRRMRINVRSVDFYRLPMKTRFPFCYGIASMTELPHLFVRAVVDIDGHESVGMSADGLPPKWFTKNPAHIVRRRSARECCSVIRHAADVAVDAVPSDSFFALVAAPL